MKKFIYVYTEDARDKMEAAGYSLLKEADGVYVFLNESGTGMNFSKPDVSYILSDTLTF